MLLRAEQSRAEQSRAEQSRAEWSYHFQQVRKHRRWYPDQPEDDGSYAGKEEADE